MKCDCNPIGPFVYKDFVLNLDDDLRPLYRLNPFNTGQLSQCYDTTAASNKSVAVHWDTMFGGRPYTYTSNGRQAIREALRLLDLQSDDYVTILTSTGNHYISKCVTSEIEAVCRWSRTFESNTKALFVNHEFGVPYPDLSVLKQHGLPIIEDCCYSFYSGTHQNQMGKVGDYVVYSFAKYFPIQFGGLLVGSTGHPMPVELLDADAVVYLQRAMAAMLPDAAHIALRRKANHNLLANRVSHLGLTPLFDFTYDGVPGVFMFTAPTAWPLPALKEFAWQCGIHCSVFYGEQAFFIPVHQCLDATAINYFVTCLEYFVHQYSL